MKPPNSDKTTEELYQTVARVLEEQFRYGLSPAELVDYIAVEKAGVSNKEWAKTRGVDHSTVSGNVAGARKKINAERLNAEVQVEESEVIVHVNDREGERHELSFLRETQVVNEGGAEASLELIYETHTAIHGYYTGPEGSEYESTLWYDGRPTNSFEEFDFFDEWGSAEAKADSILWRLGE